MILLLMLLALLVGGGTWLVAAPRSITGVSEAIIARLQPPNAPFELQVEEVQLRWESWRKPAQIYLSGIRLINAANDAELSIPEGSVSLAVLPLIRGELRIEHLQLNGFEGGLAYEQAQWRLYSDKEQLFYRFQKERNQSAQLIFPVKHLTVRAAAFRFAMPEQGASWQMKELQLSLKAENNSALDFQFALDLPADANEAKPFLLAGKGAHDLRLGEGAIDILFDGLNPEALCQLKACADLPSIDASFSGKAKAYIKAGALKRVELQAASGEGTLTHQPYLPDVIDLNSVEMDASVDVLDYAATLKELSLKMQTGTSIKASGTASYADEKLIVDARASSENMPVNHLYKYWPANLAPQSREWATSKIRGGMASEAEASIKIRPDYLEAEFLPDDFLASRIEVVDSSIDYLQGFPKVEKARATVRFTGAGMSAILHKAQLLSATRLDGTTLSFTDLNAPGTPTQTTLQVKTTPKDLALLTESFPNAPLKRAGISLAEATGSIHGEIDLAFNAFSDSEGDEINWDALRYKIKASLESLQNVRVRERFLLSDLSGNLAMNEALKKVDLRASMDGQNYAASIKQEAGQAMQWSLKTLSGDPFAQAHQDVSGSYALKDEVPYISIKGQRLDITPFSAGDEPVSISGLTPIMLDVDVGQLIVGPGQEMRNVAGTLRCDERCESAFLSSDFIDGGQVSATIFREQGVRKFSMQTDQLGKLMRVLDAGENVTGGTLSINGTYADGQADVPLNGRIIAEGFYLRDAPILGKILNAGSLVGLLDALRGDGIRFNKVKADFSFANDLLRLKEGKAAGPAMAILVEGDINLATDMLDVSGNIAPAYVLNSLVGKVPLVGNLLVGGEGESVFAINYSARGDMDDPAVVVNPLSALTPGFTRKFFDIFDTPPDTSAPEAFEEPVTPKVPKPAPEQPKKAPAVPLPESDWQVINP